MAWKLLDYVKEYFLGTKTREFCDYQKEFYQECSAGKREIKKEFRRIDKDESVRKALRDISNFSSSIAAGYYAIANLLGIKGFDTFVPLAFTLALTELPRVHSLISSYFWREDKKLENRLTQREALFEQIVRQRTIEEVTKILKKHLEQEGESWKNGNKSD